MKFLSMVLASLVVVLLFNCTPHPQVSAPQGLILRSTPATSAVALAKIPFRAELKVIETGKEKIKIEGIEAPWQKVSYEGKEGWVFSGFLTTDKSVLDRIERCPSTHRIFGQRCIPSWQYGLHSQGLVVSVENDCGYNHMLKPDGFVDGFQGPGCGRGPYRGGLGRWEIEGERIRVDAPTSFCYETGDPNMPPQGEGIHFKRYYISPRGNGFATTDEKGNPVTDCFVNCCA